jgi:hypothetical protein
MRDLEMRADGSNGRGIKKAMAFTGNRSKSSIGISFFKVKRLFSG